MTRPRSKDPGRTARRLKYRVNAILERSATLLDAIEAARPLAKGEASEILRTNIRLSISGDNTSGSDSTAVESNRASGGACDASPKHLPRTEREFTTDATR